MQTFKSVIVFGMLVAAALPTRATVVYGNLSHPLGNYLGGFAYSEVGDDLTLGAGPRVFESISVAYAAFNLKGTESLTVTMYKMDGPPTPGSFGFNTPGSPLFTATVPIAATPGTTVTITDSTGVVLPDVVGVGLSFNGVNFDPTGAGSDAGPLLFHPPSPGSSLDDFWLRGFPNPSDPWSLFTFGGNPPVNFGLEITTRDGATVPDAGSTATLLVPAMVLVGLVTARRRERTVS